MNDGTPALQNTPQAAVAASRKWRDYLSPNTNINVPGGGQVQVSGDLMSKINNFLNSGSSSPSSASGLSSSSGTSPNII
jgi:hypothetical protein